jgi:hypothetical protein
VALADSNGNEASFYRTSDPQIAAKLGITVDSTSAAIDSSSFSLAIRRNYPGHPETTIQYDGHKAEDHTPAASSKDGDETEAAGDRSEQGHLFEKFKTFFYAEKLPDFVYYKDAVEDGGNLVMSIPIDYHVSFLKEAATDLLKFFVHFRNQQANASTTSFFLFFLIYLSFKRIINCCYAYNLSFSSYTLPNFPLLHLPTVICRGSSGKT